MNITESVKANTTTRSQMDESRGATTTSVITVRFEAIPFNDGARYMDILIPKEEKLLLMFYMKLLMLVQLFGGTRLTNEQLNNLMLLLNKKEATTTDHKEGVNENDSNIITSGNLAGTLCLASKSML